MYIPDPAGICICTQSGTHVLVGLPCRAERIDEPVAYVSPLKRDGNIVIGRGGLRGVGGSGYEDGCSPSLVYLGTRYTIACDQLREGRYRRCAVYLYGTSRVLCSWIVPHSHH